MIPYIVRIVSLRKGVGKTEIGIAIAKKLIDRSINVAIIKHAHEYLELNKDTEKYVKAGCNLVYGVSRDVMVKYVRTKGLRSLDEIVHELPPTYRVVIVEGFKGIPIGDAYAIVTSIDEVNQLRNTVKGLKAFLTIDNIYNELVKAVSSMGSSVKVFRLSYRDPKELISLLKEILEREVIE